jgi:methylated-DNA-protein-cysteine methyltransferase-like protein
LYVAAASELVPDPAAAGASCCDIGEARVPGIFLRRVLSIARRIPAGRVATYGDLARMAGRPRVARAVGNIMSGCVDSTVPCHRVVGAAGRLGGYAGTVPLKRALLRAEGVVVVGNRIRRFEEVRWPR